MTLSHQLLENLNEETALIIAKEIVDFAQKEGKTFELHDFATELYREVNLVLEKDWQESAV